MGKASLGGAQGRARQRDRRLPLAHQHDLDRLPQHAPSRRSTIRTCAARCTWRSNRQELISQGPRWRRRAVRDARSEAGGRGRAAARRGREDARLPRGPKEQDIAEAEKLVKKHHPNGIDIEMAFRQVGNYSDRSQLVAAQLRRIGIRGTLKTHESAAGYAAFGKGDFTLITSQDRAMDIHGSRRHLLPHLDHPGGQQLRQVVGSEARRARRPGAERDRPGQAQEAVPGAAADLPERRRARFHPRRLGGRLVLHRQEAAWLQARASPSTTTSPS